MILKNIEVQNFGIFHGRHELELAPADKWKKPRPVVLIGGKNGAGKSTMFEAVKLCLYGLKSLPDKKSLSDYKRYLKSRVNWNTPEDETTFIKLQFSVFRENRDLSKSREYTYEVIREWHGLTDGAKEDLLIYEDDKLLSLDPELWQDFIEELIPQGVLDLFFFDGEKIQDLAEGGRFKLEVAVKSLLNLAIIPSLSTDLQLIYKRYLEEESQPDIEKEIKQLEKEISTKKAELEELRSANATIQTKVNVTKNNIRTLEKRLKNSGGQFYSKREEIKNQQAVAKNNLKSVQEKIGEMCAGSIPFMLCPPVAQKTIENLRNEKKALEQSVTTEVMTQKRKDLLNFMDRTLSKTSIPKNEMKQIRDKIEGYTDSWLSTDDKKKAILGLSPSEITQSLYILENISKEKNAFKESIDESEMLTREVRHLEQRLERALEDDSVKEISIMLSEKYQILGSQEKDLDISNEKIDRAARELNDLKRKREKTHTRIERGNAQEKNFSKIGKIKRVLQEFEARITAEKLKQLEDEILDCYSKIHRKEGFVRSFKVDPKTFAVEIFDKNNRLVPVSKLSAGEKQVYSISMLWALSKLAGKPLPMMIDTPLGRLDSTHRSNIVHNFFPHASHQVIILSTDTEIDHQYFEEMNKYISHTYSLDFNFESSSTNVGQGYLFEEVMQ